MKSVRKLCARYDSELLASGISKNRIRHYGFAFDGQKVLIGDGSQAVPFHGF